MYACGPLIFPFWIKSSIKKTTTKQENRFHVDRYVRYNEIVYWEYLVKRADIFDVKLLKIRCENAVCFITCCGYIELDVYNLMDFEDD